MTYAANFLGSDILIDNGSPEQKARFLPDIACGKSLCAFAITEETAGSDAGAVKTTATKTAEGYVLNGSKRFITNGGDASIYTIIARTEPGKSARGLSAFIVEADNPGLAVSERIAVSAPHPLGTLAFTDCKVPASAMLANPGESSVYYEVTIAGQDPGSGSKGTIDPGKNATLAFPGQMGGPLEVRSWTDSGKNSPANVAASQRVLSNYGTAFNEVPGIPEAELSNDYLWTWYDMKSPGYSDWVMLANPSDAEITYEIKIAGITQPLSPQNPESSWLTTK